jgi:uridine phosphorylase
MSAMRSYLDPTAPIAAQAVLTDDPKSAMDLAVALTDSPRMSNLAHGLWGYHGLTRDGLDLTVQSLGIGGPSAYLVVSDLAHLGVESIVRIGSCISADPDRGLGSIVVAERIEARDGVGRAASARANLTANKALAGALLRAHGESAQGIVRSLDLPHAEGADAPGATALDLSSGAVAGAANASGIRWACALVVAETTTGATLTRDALEEALLALGASAATALGAVAQPSAP